MQKKVYFCGMILNYIWISLILLAILMGLVQAICYGNVDIFSTILNSTFDSAKTGFELSLGLTGVLSLWMGIMKIGEQAGAVNSLGKAINPFFSRIFPDIPKGHPVFGTMLMNIAANMLGLDNAATPMGLKAMGELQELNTDKTKASNAMIMFVVLGASGLTLIPTTIMAYRAQLGAANPADVFLPILIATYVATLVGLICVCIAQKIKMKDPVVIGTLVGLTALVGLLVWAATLLSPHALSVVSAAIAAILLLGVICWFIIQAMCKKINVYDAFIDGAKGGFQTAIGIIPYLIAILVAVGMFRACGAMDLLERGIAWCFAACGINPDLAFFQIVLNKNDLTDAIERASLFAKVGKNNLIKLNIKENEMEITSKSEEGNVKEEVFISRDGKDLVIGFNSKYLLDSLKVIDDENIKMLFNTPISPCLIRPIEGNEYEYLVLPVRITNL